jgi:hypothetical protein
MRQALLLLLLSSLSSFLWPDLAYEITEFVSDGKCHQDQHIHSGAIAKVEEQCRRMEPVELD